MRIENREIIAAEGMYIAKVGTISFFTRCTLLDGETEKDFYEVAKEEKERLEDNGELTEAKNAKIAEVDAYDISDAVNMFSYGGADMWFNKADRVGLRNSMTAEKRAGKTQSTMWFGNVPLTVTIDEGLQLLDVIELYALECYNVTAQHKAEIMTLQSVAEVEAFDVTRGYPDKLVL